MQYKNYIFDLYGTLVDIHTDETPASFWESMAAWYKSFGADWSGEELRQSYLRMVREEEEKLAEKTGCAFPEIKLETVFLRLLNEAPSCHKASQRPEGQKEERAWLYAAANMFRVLSRKRLSRFDAVPELFKSLRKKGCRIYLLSNAQKIFTIPELEQCGLADSFDGIFISSELGIKKPDPRFLSELMKKHALAPAETVMIGNDPDTDMAVAKACGIDGVLVASDGSSLSSLL